MTSFVYRDVGLFTGALNASDDRSVPQGIGHRCDATCCGDSVELAPSSPWERMGRGSFDEQKRVGFARPCIVQGWRDSGIHGLGRLFMPEPALWSSGVALPSRVRFGNHFRGTLCFSTHPPPPTPQSAGRGASSP